MPTWHPPRVSLHGTIHGIHLEFFNIQFINLFSRSIHREYQPHTYAASLTTYRDPATTGCAFFNSTYAIRIQASGNSACFWQPRHWHGTSLPSIAFSEKGGKLVQSGLALVTSSRLPGAFAKYLKNEVKAAEMVDVEHIA